MPFVALHSFLTYGNENPEKERDVPRVPQQKRQEPKPDPLLRRAAWRLLSYPTSLSPEASPSQPLRTSAVNTSVSLSAVGPKSQPELVHLSCDNG